MRYGYFDNARREYVIERPDVPVSWTNYLGVRDMGTVISHNAGGYSFYKSAEHGRITRFRPERCAARPARPLRLCARRRHRRVLDDLLAAGRARTCPRRSTRCATACLTRSSVATTPASTPNRRSSSRSRTTSNCGTCELRNDGDRPRRLSLFSYVEFSFDHIEIDNQNLQMSLYASGSSYRDGIIEYDFFYEPWTYHFFAGNFQPDRLRLRARRVHWHLTAPRPTPSRSNRASVGAAASWAATTAARCTSALASSPAKRTACSSCWASAPAPRPGYAMQRSMRSLARSTGRSLNCGHTGSARPTCSRCRRRTPG